MNFYRCVELSSQKRITVYNYFIYFWSHKINTVSHLSYIVLSRTLRSDRQTRLPVHYGTLVFGVQLRVGKTCSRLWSCCQDAGSSDCYFWVVCRCRLCSLQTSVSLCSSVNAVTKLRNGRPKNRGGLIPGRGKQFQVQSTSSWTKDVKSVEAWILTGHFPIWCEG